MNITILKEIIREQKQLFVDSKPGIKRDVDIKHCLTSKQIIVISGIRRCGKSTLMRQISEKYNDFNYVNFDDERLINFSVENFDDLMTVFQQFSNSKIIFADEIQNVGSWERVVRRIHDQGYKIYLTGSNAKMLSNDLGTHLTGRYKKIELFPFSFKEFLLFNNIKTNKITTKIKSVIVNAFDQYLSDGGMPEFLKYNDVEFLSRTYEDILYRDIISRHNIKRVKDFKFLSHYLFSNFTGDFNYNKLKNSLKFKSATTVKEYISYLEKSYLGFELLKFDFSLKRQYNAEKKFFVIDNGMRNNITFNFSKNYGKLLENLVFLELKRRYEDLYFFRNNQGETDFVAVDKIKNKIDLIQVCYDINIDNRNREIKGLIEAMKTLEISIGYILTMNRFETIKIDNYKIKIIPTWRWLLYK